MLSKRIFNSPMNLRKLIFTPQFNVIHRFCQTNDPTDTGEKSLNLKFHKLSPIPKKLTSLLNTNEQTIEGDKIINLMKGVMKVYKQEKLKPEALSSQDFFRNVCQILNLNLDKLNITQTIYVLKILNKLQVPSSSRLISSLLQHIDALFTMKNSTMEDFCKLSVIINKLTPTSSTKAMTKSLNRKYIMKICTEFDESNSKFAANALIYAIYNLNDKQLLKKLMKTIEGHEFNNVKSSTIISLMYALISLNYYPEGYKKVLSKTQEYLIKNVTEISNETILFLSRSIAMKIRNERLNDFYNKTLIEKFIEKLVSNDIGFEKGILFLNSLNELFHTNKEILNYLSAKYYEEKYLNMNDITFEIEKLLVLVSGLAYMKHKPIFWEEIFNTLRSKKILNCSNETLIIYSVHLACLNCYDPVVLNKIFTVKHDFKNRPFIHWSFIRLYQKLKTMNNYDGPFPSQDLIKSYLYLERKTKYPLLQNLEQAVGGSAYVKTNLQTKLHHYIDHIVVYRSGGYPVAINTEKNCNNTQTRVPIEYLEDLNMSQNCQVVSILMIPIQWYSRSTNQILGPFSIYIESLETLSYKVVTVCDKIWLQLQDSYKIPFLMNEIKSKLNYEKAENQNQ